MQRTTHLERRTVAELVIALLFVLASGIWLGGWTWLEGQVLDSSGLPVHWIVNLPLLFLVATLGSVIASFLILHLPHDRDSRLHSKRSA